jgi:hypothetical protein
MTRFLSACALAVLFATAATAHHSYAMFDGEHVAMVNGTLAKIEWKNPHVFLWVYVPNPQAANGFDLYAFENGSTNVLARRGWSKDVIPTGEKIAVEFWPLRDGRKGGHLKEITRSSGAKMQGAGGPRGLDGTDPAAQVKEPAP